MTIEEIYSDFLKMSADDRRKYAAGAGLRILEGLKALGVDEENSYKFIVSVIGICIAADGRVTQGEADMFNFLFGSNLSVNDLAEMCGCAADPEFVDAWDKLVDRAPEEVKGDFCILGLAFLSDDGQLTPAEKALFEKILA